MALPLKTSTLQRHICSFVYLFPYYCSTCDAQRSLPGQRYLCKLPDSLPAASSKKLSATAFIKTEVERAGTVEHRCSNLAGRVLDQGPAFWPRSARSWAYDLGKTSSPLRASSCSHCCCSMRGGHSAGEGVLGSLWTSRFLHVSRNYVFFEITEPKQKHQTHGSLDINVCDKALF